MSIEAALYVLCSLICSALLYKYDRHTTPYMEVEAPALAAGFAWPVYATAWIVILFARGINRLMQKGR